MTMHFHFIENLKVAQIQLFAKVVKCMMDGEFSMEYLNLIDCPFPKEANDAQSLQDYCRYYPYNKYFYISTPRFNALKYIYIRRTQILSIDSSLYLASLQEIFNDFKGNEKELQYLNVFDELSMAFNSINTDLTLFYVKKADDEDSFSWRKKYGPCFFDRGRFQELRWRICLALYIKSIGECFSSQMEITLKSLLMSLVYQCGYISFWSCLADVLTFPGITPQENEVLNNFTNYMLKNYANIYVYNLSVEEKPVSGKNINTRGATENTTRIKLYFTRDNGIPVLIRMDLPHKGEPYVHLNIQEEESNNHFRLSHDVIDDEYDHVFDNLSSALLQYDFNVVDSVHSSADDDERILKDMCYRTALFIYAPYAYYYQILGADKIGDAHNFEKQAWNVLVELLECSLGKEEIIELAPPDLLDMAYCKLFVE